MGLLSFLIPVASHGQTRPQREGADTHVVVKRTNRERTVDALAFDPDLALAADIRKQLPNAPREPNAPLRAALIARAYRCRLRAGVRLTEQEGASLADAIDALSAFAIQQCRAKA